MHKITSVKSHKMWVVIVSGMGIMGVGGGIGGSNSVCILMFLNWVSPHLFHHNANGGGRVCSDYRTLPAFKVSIC